MQRNDREESLIQVSVMLEGPCVFVRLAAHHGAWPYLLRNDSDHTMLVSQAVSCSSGVIVFREMLIRICSVQDAYDPLGPASSASNIKVYTLEPQSKMSYAWDLPASTNKQLKITIGKRDRLVNVLEIGSQVPFRLVSFIRAH